MEKDNKSKGLSDMQDGEFMLNESGTSVSIDAPEEEIQQESENKKEDKNNEQEEKK